MIPHGVDSRKQRLAAGRAYERSPERRQELAFVFYALCCLIQFELRTIIAPQLVRGMPLRGTCVLMSEEADITQVEVICEQDGIEHDRHEPLSFSQHLLASGYL